MSRDPSVTVASILATLFCPTTPAANPLDPDDLGSCIYAMCDGDYEAAEIVTLKLRPVLLEHVRHVLDTYDADAEDIVDDLLAEMIDERMAFPRTTGVDRSVTAV